MAAATTMMMHLMNSTMMHMMNNMNNTMDHGQHNQMMNNTMDHGGHNHADHNGMDHNGMDHSTVDHSGMDHSGMDHGGMDHSSHGNGTGLHNVFFHLGFKEIILFEEWATETDWHMGLTCLFFFFLAVFYEGLKAFREFISKKYKSSPVVYINGGGVEKAATRTDNEYRSGMCSCIHIVQSFLHILQVFMSYVLMIVFMLLNVWLVIAVCLGAGVGYYLFGWRREQIADANEHCM